MWSTEWKYLFYFIFLFWFAFQQNFFPKFILNKCDVLITVWERFRIIWKETMLFSSCFSSQIHTKRPFIFSFSWNHRRQYFSVFANSMVCDDKLAMVERRPEIQNRNLLYYHLTISNNIKMNLTISVNKTPAAKMKMVCENCWTIPPHTKPTIPNNVMIIRDNFSALPCPSKSCNIH